MGAKYIKSLLLDEGNYFLATNPTIGVDVPFGSNSNTTYTSSRAAFTWKNNSTAGKVIIPDVIRLFLSTGTPPVASISICAAMRIDNSTTRSSTNQHADITPKNMNTLSTAASIALFSAFSTSGILTTTELTSVRHCGISCIPTGLMVPGDIYEWQFGQLSEQYMQASTLRTSVQAAKFVDHLPGVVIAPTQFGVFHMWIPTMTSTAAFQYHVGWWEI